MSYGSTRNSIATLAVVTAGAIGLFVAPAAVTDPIRTTVRDSVLPGHRAIEAGVENIQAIIRRMRQSDDVTIAFDETASKIEDAELNVRRLQIENARLRQQIDRDKRIGVSPYRTAASKALLLDDMISATVFGKETAILWKSGSLLDKGSTDGLRESDLVLRDTGPLIDQGADSRLATGFPIFCGRCVFGRVANVGRWTSSVQRITDVNFRGHAQLVRTTADGHIFGAEGVLEGSGESLCRLKFIAADVSVAVGDDVYTASRKGMFPFPMYYGKVVRAELKPGAAHWEISVKPALGDFEPEMVQVLRKRLNPARLTNP